MDRREVIQMFSAGTDPLDLSIWLRETYLPNIVERFNTETSRKRYGLYQNERIPVNERNLTDVRTRMGQLIEFELASLSNQLLNELRIDNIFWSNVVANRFPDLEIRKNSGELLFRLEIKSIQCTAEEKSANFFTLKKDINPSTDFVIAFLWDWSSGGATHYQWDSAPKILKAYVFQAYSLASLRDTYWLNRPPENLGNGYQGFDVRFGVTCKDSIFTKEQGNYGKLMRIWERGFQYRPVESDVLIDTENEYLMFQEESIWSGFEILAHRQLQQLNPGQTIDEIHENGKCVGYKSGDTAYIMRSKLSERQASEFAGQNNVEVVVKMTEKYKSTVFQVDNTQNDVIVITRNEKPKNVVSILDRHES